MHRSRAAAIAALTLLARPAAAETLESWPCAGCETVVPPRVAAAPSVPAPLLVALHGDGGGVRPLVRAWKAACEEAGVILVAPRCPRDLGCTAQSFWKWYAEGGHDPAWLGAQIDAVTARYVVDPARVYATGYSGGATYLGWYVPAHSARFAAVAHVAGGAPYGGPCPSCKVPVLFVLGATDPMITPYTAPLRRWYDGCGGHEVVWETLPGVTHESILETLAAGKAKQILGWLLARPISASCAPPPVTLPLDAGPAADAGAEDAALGPGGGSTPPAAGGPSPSSAAYGADPPPGLASPSSTPPPGSACACGRGGPGGAVALIGPLLAAWALGGRSGRRQCRAIHRRSR